MLAPERIQTGVARADPLAPSFPAPIIGSPGLDHFARRDCEILHPRFRRRVGRERLSCPNGRGFADVPDKVQIQLNDTHPALAVAETIDGATVLEFTREELARWEEHFEDVAAKGRGHFTDPALGTNGVVCAQCHPNAANTHPETYPKFQKQLGRVAAGFQFR